MKNKLFLFALLSNIFEYIAGKLGFIQFDGEPESIEISINEQAFKVSKADFAKAIEQKKLSIKDENYFVFSKPDFETRTKNIETEHYNQGKIAEREMLIKKMKKEKGLEDIEGKDFDTLFETYAKRKVNEANIPVDKKVQEHEKTIGELRGNLTTLQTENEQLKSEKTQIANDFKQKEYQLEINNTLNLLVPEKAVTDTMTRKDIIALFRANGFDAKMVDSKIVAVDYNKNPEGDVIKHSITLEPEPLDKVINAFVDAKKLIIKGDGRGEGDKTNTGETGGWQAFVDEMTKKGISSGSEKFNAEMKLRVKSKTLDPNKP